MKQKNEAWRRIDLMRNRTKKNKNIIFCAQKKMILIIWSLLLLGFFYQRQPRYTCIIPYTNMYTGIYVWCVQWTSLHIFHTYTHNSFLCFWLQNLLIFAYLLILSLTHFWLKMPRNHNLLYTNSTTTDRHSEGTRENDKRGMDREWERERDRARVCMALNFWHSINN